MATTIEAIALAIVCIVLCEAAGSVGSVWTRRSLDWFDSLKKPWFTPPGYLIGAIWTGLFFLMGVSLYLVIEAGIDGKDVFLPLAVFAVQFALNIAWSYAFFGRRSPFFGLIEIVMLWIAIVAAAALFFDVSPTAGALLLPYIVWVSVAAVLNGTIFAMNKYEGVERSPRR